MQNVLYQNHKWTTLKWHHRYVYCSICSIFEILLDWETSLRFVTCREIKFPINIFFYQSVLLLCMVYIWIYISFPPVSYYSSFCAHELASLHFAMSLYISAQLIFCRYVKKRRRVDILVLYWFCIGYILQLIMRRCIQ